LNKDDNGNILYDIHRYLVYLLQQPLCAAVLYWSRAISEIMNVFPISRSIRQGRASEKNYSAKPSTNNYGGPFCQAIRSDLEAWAGCIAGALEEETYRQLLAEVGFTNIEIEVTRRYSIQDVADSGGSASIAALSDSERAEVDGKFVSAFIRARKPL
jgi:hypothetical protein